MKTRFLALLFSTLALLSLSCGRSGHTETPPMKVGTFYDIVFPAKAEGMPSGPFRVVAVTDGSWIQAETYPNSLFLRQLLRGLASKESSLSKEELAAEKKETVERIRQKKVIWINLQVAASVTETDPKMLEFLKDL
ncbi:hypothetical protein JIN84_06060 [Luteolibacter yonseiensis]|uniref:Lipoprotein n=1 Tax=Luteolibacter yonseiensis TaxID=1144680 RepID=A0A934V6L6_9BACT|nr:hypothetical protein [Luteolibacter yonseiensis]MBK1815167.1 hypothetical protein [Luteolibacter yonseiensis]